MNDHFAASVSALEKLNHQLTSIQGKPVDIVYRGQGSHTKKTRNYYRSTTHGQMKTELWKWQYCTSYVVLKMDAMYLFHYGIFCW